MFSSGKFSNHVNKSRVLYAWIMLLILFFTATIGLTLAFFYNDDWGSGTLGTSGPVKIEAVGMGDISIEDSNRTSKLAVTLDNTYGNVIQGGTPIDLTANCKVYASTTNPLLRASFTVQFVDPATGQLASGSIVDGFVSDLTSQLHAVISGNDWYSYQGWYYYIGTDGVTSGGNTILNEVQFENNKNTIVHFIDEQIHFPTSITSAYSGCGVKFVITFQAIQNFIPNDAGQKMENTITNSLKIFEDVNPDDSGSGDFVYEYTEDGKGIYFGYWPQTIKDSSVTVASTPDDDGYYLGSDGERYAKLTIDFSKLEQTGNASQFLNGKMNVASDGTTLNNGGTYFFKLEKLKWIILDLDEGTNKATVLCDRIIQGQQYQGNITLVDTTYYATDDDDNILLDEDGKQVYANNYRYSQLRNFLTNTFYNTAFSHVQRALIQEISVDNSAGSTNSNSNIYACENTMDRIWTLSYGEHTSRHSLYTSNNDKLSVALNLYYKQTTDYARGMGVFTYTKQATSGITIYDILYEYGFTNAYSTESMTYEDCNSQQKLVVDAFYNSGEWWLRSPNASNSVHAHRVLYNGKGQGTVNRSYRGVAPALQIQL